jgi:TIR domain/WD domain, G-beta repeat
MADAFISYSRKDEGFVRVLEEALEKRGKEVWVDVEDIPIAAKWRPEIYSGIEGADTFVFVISPDSIASEECKGELYHATKHNKRLVPILRREVDTWTAPDVLESHNWVFFRESDDFGESLDGLVQAMDTDLEWVKFHTRLLTRAVEWESRGRDSSFLLRGSDLEAAEEGQARATNKEPELTSLQRQYILASRGESTRRQRLILGAVTVGMVVAIVLGAISLWQWGVARSNEKKAQANAKEARMQASIALSRQLLAQASEVQESQPDLSLLLNAEALKRAPATAKDEARFSLLSKLTRQYHVATQLTGHTATVNDVAFSPPDDKLLASASLDGKVRLWDAASGKQRGQPLTGDEEAVYSVAFSPDGKLLASAGADKTVRLSNIEVKSLISEACRIANRDLSKDEWSRFVGPEFNYARTCSRLPTG